MRIARYFYLPTLTCEIWVSRISVRDALSNILLMNKNVHIRYCSRQLQFRLTALLGERAELDVGDYALESNDAP